MLKDALILAKLGFAVFPLASNTKMPTKGSKGVKDATKDPEQIKKLFTRNPNSKPFNIGIALGEISMLVCVDLDRNHGATDEDLKRFPRTVTVKTRNGFHLYFLITRPCKKGALWGGKNEGDNTAPAYLRTDGQYVVGPSSSVTWNEETQQHFAPHEYSYFGDAGGELSFQDCQLAHLPDEWYRDGIRTQEDGRHTVSSEPASEPQSVAGTQHTAGSQPAHARPIEKSSRQGQDYESGLRHDMFVRTAVSMRKRGKSIDDIRRVVTERNRIDTVIPKENAEKEINSLCKWIEENVRPLIVFQLNDITGEFKQYIKPLGHRDDCYYYTTSDNKMIIKLGRASHTMGNLLDLMPMHYWAECYPKKKRNKEGETIDDGTNWALAASELMEACRFVGIYSDQNVRGVGCWEDQDKLVYHTGSELIVDGQQKSLNGIEGTNYLYTLRPSVAKASADRPLSLAECSTLLQACQAITWRHEQSAVLLSGALALSRLCGALSWRPHIWLTGPAGCGKSSVLEYVVAPILGNSGINVQGETTAAGIRQALESDSKPVLFDEAETNNERSSKRMQHILELARQASFENEGKILKGTADGSGHSYKITSSFILASIRVNLVEEADISRFSVLELGIADPIAWPDVKKKLTAITKVFGDRLHTRMMLLWPVLKQNILMMENQIARLHDRRVGQQYGTLIAGWYALTSDGLMTPQEADYFAGELKLDQSKTETASADERDCLDWLLASQVKYELKDVRFNETFGRLINKAAADDELRDVLMRHGLDVKDEALFVSSQNPHLQSVYRDTKWGNLFHQALARLDAARRTKHRFNRTEMRCVSVPVATVFPK